MKKNFLFKWVSVLGATLLLINLALPGFVAYAQEADPVPNEEQETATVYNFRSYGDAAGNTEYATGTVELADWSYVEVTVTSNSVEDWEGKSFFISSNATTNGEEKYQLYAEGEDGILAAIPVRVSITEPDENEEDGVYNFRSYGDAAGNTEYATGTVELADWSYVEVTVTSNSVEDWEGKSFFISSNATTNGEEKYQLYAEGEDGILAAIPVRVKISEDPNAEEPEEEQELTDEEITPFEWTFEEGKTYFLHVAYTLADWYKLADEYTYSVNGTAKNGNIIDGEEWLAVEFEYTATAAKSNDSSSSSSSSSSRSSWWGGSSKSTTKTAETKANTWDTAKVDNAKTDNKVTDNNTNDNTKTPAYNDKYSQEFNDAYQFAYKNGITTMPSIEEADMEWTLTRIAMAKMLSQYAINVLGKTPDTTKVVPAFPDVTAQMDADYNNGVTLAYQLWIMWIGIDKFRPDDLVTRAEFATALSRLLFNTPDGEWAYYETHLAKLMEEKIITNNNPDLQELRGYVMIMLMRSAQS